MKTEIFNYLWEQGIVLAAKGVIEEISDEDKSLYNVKLDLSDRMHVKVFKEYDMYRLRIREKYFNSGNNDENKIDGHKICACITGALLNVCLISFDKNNENIPKSIYYSNYAVAFLSSIYIMYLFLLSDYERDGKTNNYNKLLKQATFVFPETNEGHDSYSQGRIKTLALNDICGIDFDVLTYADMLFWIEKYNKDLIDSN